MAVTFLYRERDMRLLTLYAGIQIMNIITVVFLNYYLVIKENKL